MSTIIAHKDIHEFNHLSDVIGTFKIKDKGETTLAKIVKTKDSNVREIHYAVCKERIVYQENNKKGE